LTCSPWINPGGLRLKLIKNGKVVFGVNPPYGRDTFKWLDKLSSHGNGTVLNHMQNNRPHIIMSPFLYFGGKGILAKKLIPLLPSGNLYAEPFCGAASMFWRLPDNKYPLNVLNDLNKEIVNLFRVLQDKDSYETLKHRINWTLYSRDEFRHALQYNGNDRIELAWNFYVKQNQGFGGIANSEGNWGRAFVGSANGGKKWNNRKKLFQWWHEKLAKVQVDNIPAIEFIKYWDKKPGAVFYVDPPYVNETRRCGGYKHEMDTADHIELLETLNSVQGKVLLSGYNSDMYDDFLKHWCKIEFEVFSKVANTTQNDNNLDIHKRTEVVWMNFADEQPQQGRLF